MSPRRVALLAATLAIVAAAHALAEPRPGDGPRPERESYLLHCSGCHGLDARGIPGHSPSLHGLAGLLEREGGRAYLIRVPGVAQAPLDDTALAALMNWLLDTYSPGHAAARYRAEETGRLRADPLRDPLAARPSASPDR